MVVPVVNERVLVFTLVFSEKLPTSGSQGPLPSGAPTLRAPTQSISSQHNGGRGVLLGSQHQLLEMTTSHFGSERLSASRHVHFLVSKNTSDCHRKGDYRAEDRPCGSQGPSRAPGSWTGIVSGTLQWGAFVFTLCPHCISSTSTGRLGVML
ncbi:unnamed protein product [Boreogadus saida]